jgi:hypothetical protein
LSNPGEFVAPDAVARFSDMIVLRLPIRIGGTTTTPKSFGVAITSCCEKYVDRTRQLTAARIENFDGDRLGNVAGKLEKTDARLYRSFRNPGAYYAQMDPDM